MERWALITAGAQGLGGAITEHLSTRGFNVVVHYFGSRARAEALEAKLGAAGGVVRLVQADLASAPAREAMMAEVRALVPALHLLVNNLGVYPEEHLLETTIESFERTFALTCTANFHLTQLAIPMLVAAAPAARVVNIGDSACDRITARDQATPYHIAKIGVNVLTRTYARRLMRGGVTVNMISPGFLENSVGDPGDTLPSGRPGTFADILGALDYLLSDSARYVSGANLLVSGAWNT